MGVARGGAGLTRFSRFRVLSYDHPHRMSDIQLAPLTRLETQDKSIDGEVEQGGPFDVSAPPPTGSRNVVEAMDSYPDGGS